MNRIRAAEYITLCYWYILSCSMSVCQLISLHILNHLQAITKFESLANQIQKNAGDIDERLHMIESVRLFKQPPPKQGCELPEAKVSKEAKILVI